MIGSSIRVKLNQSYLLAWLVRSPYRRYLLNTNFSIYRGFLTVLEHSSYLLCFTAITKFRKLSNKRKNAHLKFRSNRLVNSNLISNDQMRL